MENAHDVDVSIRLYQVGNAIVAKEQYANLSSRREMIAITRFREPAQQLCLVIDALHRPPGSLRIIHCNVIIDIVDPLFGLSRLVQFRHERILRRISSLLMVRPASESASPRWTIFEKISSRTISS